MTHSRGLLLLGWLVLPCIGVAQTDAWERIRIIEQGRKVEVRQITGRPISGKFDSFDATGIKVKNGGGDVVSIARGNVRSVSLVIGKSRGKKAAIGFGVTAGVLGTLAGVACLSSGACDDGGGFVAVAIVYWAAIVAGISALFPPHKEPIYVAAPSPGASTNQSRAPKRFWRGRLQNMAN